MKDELIAIVANTLGIDVKNVPYDSNLIPLGITFFSINEHSRTTN